MRMIFIQFILSIVFTCSISAESSIETEILVQDLVLGELSMGAAGMFWIDIRNHTDSPIKLAFSGSSDWLWNSSYWKTNLIGPTDERCSQFRAHFESTTVGIPYLEIPAKGNKKFQLNLVGAGAVGDYTISVQYDGKDAPDGYYRGAFQAPEGRFRINQPSGIDAIISNKWREQNPDKPWCIFPIGMSGDLSDISDYPTSRYSAWIMFQQFRGFAESDFTAVMNSIESSDHMRRELWVPNDNGSGKKPIRGIEALEWKHKWFDLVLQHHPDILFADHLRLMRALDELALKQHELAGNDLRFLAKTAKGEIKDKAALCLRLAKEKGWLKDSTD